MTAPPAARCDACVCDLDGVVAGVYNGARGGCAAGRELVQQLVQKTTAPVPLCPVPKECADAGVQNATAAMQTSTSTGWAQPGASLSFSGNPNLHALKYKYDCIWY